MKTRILKVHETDDETREIAFQLDWLRSLTEEERVQLVLEWSRELIESLARNGHPLPAGITKRP